MNEWSIRHQPLFACVTASVVALCVLVLAVKLADGRPASAACQGNFSIDFAGLAHGTIIDNQYAAQGVQVSVQANEGFPDAIIVFDTNRPPTHDPDLAVDIGNIAILPKNLTDGNSDGLVDDPDENNFGGKVTFSFDQDVSIGSFIYVDHDHQPSDFAAAYDASGNLIKKVLIPIAGNGSVQTVNVDADGVRRFELVYRDSGGFTGIEVSCPSAATPTPTPTGGQGATATPTSAPEGATPTPTATPVTAGTSTPTVQPTVVAATATPAVRAAGAAAPGPTAPSAVAAAVSGPGAQGLPVTGGRPDDGGLAWPALPLTLAGVLAALAGGALLTHARRAAAHPAVSQSTGVRSPNPAQTFERAAGVSKAGGLACVALVALYAAIAAAGLLTRRRDRD
jgi:hypothetical protein